MHELICTLCLELMPNSQKDTHWCNYLYAKEGILRKCEMELKKIEKTPENQNAIDHHLFMIELHQYHRSKFIQPLDHNIYGLKNIVINRIDSICKEIENSKMNLHKMKQFVIRKINNE